VKKVGTSQPFTERKPSDGQGATPAVPQSRTLEDPETLAPSVGNGDTKDLDIDAESLQAVGEGSYRAAVVSGHHTARKQEDRSRGLGH
jgi:hypothetical protein